MGHIIRKSKNLSAHARAGRRVAGWGALPQSYTLRLSRWRHAPLVTQGVKVEEGEREEEAEEEEEQTRAGG